MKSEVQTNKKNEDDTEKNISGKGIGAKPIDGSVTNEQREVRFQLLQHSRE
ncbi:MAG: hypothetical protein NC453_08405 [Muribaculum sp.]|nr:hypothetical protein [Muribaculum sp.]